MVVNGRHVYSNLIAAAVSKAYGTTLPSGRYPVGVVVVEVDPKNIDVNVHPAKTEIRFADEQGLFALVSKAVASAIGSSVATSSSRSGETKAYDVHQRSRSSYVPSDMKAGSLFAADAPTIVGRSAHSADVQLAPLLSAIRRQPDACEARGLVSRRPGWESCCGSDRIRVIVDQHGNGTSAL